MQRSTDIEHTQPDSESDPAIVNEILSEMNAQSNNNGYRGNQSNQGLQDHPGHESLHGDEGNHGNIGIQEQQHNIGQQDTHQDQLDHQDQQGNSDHQSQLDYQDHSDGKINENIIQQDISNNNHLHQDISNNNHLQQEIKHNIVAPSLLPPTVKDIRQNNSNIEQLQDPLKVIAIFVLLSLPLWDSLLSSQLGKYIHSTNVLSLSIISLKGILAGLIFYLMKRFI